MKFVPLSESSENQTEEGGKTLKFVPLADEATTKQFVPLGAEPAGSVTNNLDAAPVKSETRRANFAPGEEFVRGVKRAATADLPSLWEQTGVIKDAGAALTVGQRLDLFNKIDSGEVTSPDQMRGLDMTTGQGRMYLASSPEMRAKMRDRLTKELGSRKELVNASLETLKQYQAQRMKLGARVEKLTDIENPTDFTNWLASNVGAGAVNLAPIMLAAVTTGGAGLLGVGATMGTAESVGNRLDALRKELDETPAEQRAEKVIRRLKETGSTDLAVGVTSGLLDTILGPAAAAVKQTAKSMVQQTRAGAVKQVLKQTPRQMGEEFVTGGAQSLAQTAGKVNVGEQKEFLTKETFVNALNDAAAEAAGSPAGTAFNAARATLQAGGTKEDAKQEANRAKSQREQRAPEPTAAETPPVDLGPLGEERPGAEKPVTFVPLTAAEEDAAVYKEQYDTLLFRGIPPDSADRIAKRRVVEARKQRIRDIIVKPTEDEIQARAKELIDTGVDPVQAIDLAAQQIVAERETDAQAEREGAVNAQPTVSTADRTSAEMAGQPGGVAPTAGAGVTEPTGVVPAGQTTAGTVAGEGEQPGALSEKEIAEFDARVESAKRTAQINFASALDQVNDPMYGGDLDAALDSYRQNTLDTLSEEGEKDPDVVLRAEREFDRLVEAHKTPPAAEAPKAKRGRPAVLTEEEKQQRAEDKRPVQAAKAKAERSLIRLTNKLDELATLPDEGDFETDEDYEAALADHRAERRETIKSLLQMQADPLLRGTKVGERVKVALARPDVSEKEKADLKAGIEAQKRAQGDRPSSSRMTKGKADAAFGEFKNAAQAITHVIRTGNKTQKEIAKRLRSFVTNVKFVVVEKSDALPPQLARHDKSWRQSIGLFIENYNTGERAIYVRGASFGEDQGINNVTVLHELLHAATNRKIALAEDQAASGRGQDTQLAAVYRGLLDVMRKAQNELADQASSGNLATNIADLYETTGGEFIADPREFLAYGMTDEGFQDFLVTAEGLNEPRLISSFVRVIRRFFGFPPSEQNALTSLVLVTDALLSVRAPKNRVRGEQVSSMIIPEDEDEMGNPIRTAAEMKKAERRGKLAVETSRYFEELSAAPDLMEMRDPNKVLPILRTLVRRNWIGMSDTATKALVASPTFTFLADWSGIPSLQDVAKNMQLMNGLSNQLLVGAQKVIAPVEKALNPFFFAGRKAELRKKLEDVVLESTLDRYDPTDPNKKEVSRRIDRMYSELGAEGQKLYKMIRDYYNDLIEFYSDILDRQIENLQGISPEIKQNLMLTLRRTFEAEARIKPYFPLIRYGDYWARITVDEEPIFLMFESKADRTTALEKFAEDQGTTLEELTDERKVEFGAGVRDLRSFTQGQSAMLTQIFAALDSDTKNLSSPETKEALKDAIYQIYLTTLPEQSFRNQFIRRKDRFGFSTDLVRNMATAASKMSYQMAKLQYAPMLRNSMDSARDVAKQNGALQPFVDEAQARVDLALSNPSEGVLDAIAGAANKAGFLMYLSSAASALVQPVSLYISALPIIGANNSNMAGAAKELMRAVGDIRNYGVMTTNADGSTALVAPSLSNSDNLTADEKDAVRAMEDRGLARNTYASLVWQRQGVSTDYDRTYLGRTKKLGKEAGNLVVGALMHNVERLTREAVFLAAYRVARKRFEKKGYSSANAHLAAIDQAANDVNESLADYDMTNRPRWMQTSLGRVAFQFKMFPLHTVLLLGTNFLKMMPLLNNEGKAAAAKKFFGIMLTTASIAGISGVPILGSIINAVAWMVSQALKAMDMEDEDDELRKLDPMLWFRTVFLPEQLGEVMIGDTPLSDLLDTGPLNALTGAAISERVGLADIFDIFGRDTREGRSSREELQGWVFQNLGPTASTALSFADAKDAWMLGDYAKFREKIAPAVFRNPMLAKKMAQEGIKDANGQVIVGPEEVTAWQIFMQGIGFRPAFVARASDAAFKLTSDQQKILNQKKLVLGRIKVQARKQTEEGDELMQKIIETELPEFNRKYPEFSVDATELTNLLLQDAKDRASSRFGVKVNKQNINLSSRTLDYLEKRAERELRNKDKEK